MTEASVELQPESTGPKIRTNAQTVSASSVHLQVIGIGDPSSTANLAGVTAAGALQVDATATTQAVTVISMTAGTVTSATITAALPAGSNVIGGVKLYDPNGNTAAVVTASSALKVDGSATTQPVSGTVTANQGTGSTANPWSIQGLQPTATTIAIANSASSGSVSVTNMNIVTAIVTANTALSGLTAVFEGTADGSNWVQLQGGRTDSSIIENGPTTIASANTPRAWDVPVGGLTTMRWRTTALGAGAATVSLAPQTLPYDPAPSMGLSNVGGTTVAAVAKGTQAGNAIGVQDLKDSGRNYLTFYYDRITGVTSEAMATMTVNKQGTTSSTASYSVTAGKTLRLIALHCEILNTTTTANRSFVRVRHNTGGAAATNSPVVAMAMAVSQAALAASGGVDDFAIPDGVEIAAGQQIGISHLETVTTAAIASAILVGYEY